jgi:secreted Zn-dependent insulinase-like peptidase
MYAAVIDFHKQHYSAERMKLAVMGRESLDTLQAMVEELFAPVTVRGARLLIDESANVLVFSAAATAFSACCWQACGSTAC